MIHGRPNTINTMARQQATTNFRCNSIHKAAQHNPQHGLAKLPSGLAKRIQLRLVTRSFYLGSFPANTCGTLGFDKMNKLVAVMSTVAPQPSRAHRICKGISVISTDKPNVQFVHDVERRYLAQTSSWITCGAVRVRYWGDY